MAAPRLRPFTDPRSGLIALIVLLVGAVLGYVWLRPSRVPLPDGPPGPPATLAPPAPEAGRPPAAHPIAIVPEPRAELSAEPDR